MEDCRRTVVVVGQGLPLRERGVRWAKTLDINNVGCCSEKEVELSTVRDDTFQELTIDCGAGENVMSEHMAPRTRPGLQGTASWCDVHGGQRADHAETGKESSQGGHQRGRDQDDEHAGRGCE